MNRPIDNPPLLPRPFLKWAGGKRQLLSELMPRINAAEPFERYHEPFVGGGALFFELTRLNKLEEREAHLSDQNEHLADAYCGLREDVEGLIELLFEHKRQHSKEYYLAVRQTIPEALTARAARIIYLNKTCFNGLFRENSKGLFNVPMGRYQNPRICDEPNLRACAEALRHATIQTRSFETILDHAKAGDLVYFDPPYHPLSKTASFTKYAKDDFGEDDQRRLAEVFHELTKRKVKVLLSNSMTDFICGLYDKPGVTIEEVLAKRCVNSRADRRGKISEALIRNF